jgi:hypothetical protein
VPDTLKTQATRWFSRPLKRWTDANVDYGVRLAEIVRKGYADFGRHVTEDNVVRLDTSNGLLRGMLGAWGGALKEYPGVATKFYEALTATGVEAPPRAPSRAKRTRKRATAARSSPRARK